MEDMIIVYRDTRNGLSRDCRRCQWCSLQVDDKLINVSSRNENLALTFPGDGGSRTRAVQCQSD